MRLRQTPGNKRHPLSPRVVYDARKGGPSWWGQRACKSKCDSDISDSDDDTNTLGATQYLSKFNGPSIDFETPQASAEDVQATLDFKKTKAFMSRKTTIS